jgi:hypothetical protein
MARNEIKLGLLAMLLAAGACKPDLGAPPSLVTGPRLLAVRGTPPEGKPGDMIAYDALAVDVSGRVADPTLGWALCLEPHPPAESNIVNSACVTVPDDATGSTFMAPIPTDANNACMLFGPITPTPKPGQPTSRPADADVTGGYYQPVRTVWTRDDGSQEMAFTLQRILCPLANAALDVANQYQKDYVPNVNPVISALTLDPDGAATSLFAAGQTAPPAPATVAPGQVVTLEATWPPEAQESFLVYDVAAHMLVTQTESLRLAWFVTDGALEFDATGRTDVETETFTRNVWTAPTTAGTVHLWTVLRDSRGGVDFAEAQIIVGS